MSDYMYGYGRRGSWGRGGRWPGNGPFRDLPPWERPGWLYGPGSCWTLGYWRDYGVRPPLAGQVTPTEEREALQIQRGMLESQLKSIQEAFQRIEKRLTELEGKE
jgi:hypothetical protein